MSGTPDEQGAWTTVRVDPGSAREEALAALFAAGAQGVHEDDPFLVTHFPPGTDTERVRHDVMALVPGAEVSCIRSELVDWSEAWKGMIGAHRLRTLEVVPPWLTDGREPGRTVVIDPGMAFGTGEHETTRGVIRLLHDVLRVGDFVADLGTGSGVLAIAAAKLGARRVIAIELDPDAIGNAEENVARNGVADRVHVIEGDAATMLSLVRPVDVVLANIISSVLVEMLPAMAEALAADGRAILSGILVEEREQLLGVLAERGWRATAEDQEDIWWSVAVERRGVRS